MPSFPAWAIFIIVLLVIMVVFSGAYYTIRKRISRKKTVIGAQEPTEPMSKQKIKEPIHSFKHEKSSSYHRDDIEAHAGQPPCHTTLFTTPLTKPESTYSRLSTDSKKTACHSQSTLYSPYPASPLVSNEDMPMKPQPPFNASFFSDKMELDASNELYYGYSQHDFASIQLEDKPFLSTAAAHLQQKAATIKSSLRQSLRRKKSSAKNMPVHQFFSNETASTPPETKPISRQVSLASSWFPNGQPSFQQTTPVTPETPKPDLSGGYFTNHHYLKKPLAPFGSTITKENVSNKIMIDDIPSTLPSPQANQYDAQEEINLHRVASKEDLSDQDYKEPTTPQEEATHAARKIIRSASRKSRTRSMIASSDTSPSFPTILTSNKQLFTYATVRDNNNQSIKDNMTKEGLMLDSLPVMEDSARNRVGSALCGSATVSGKKSTRVQELQKILQSSQIKTDYATMDRHASLKKMAGSAAGPKSLRNLFEPIDTNPELIQTSLSTSFTTPPPPPSPPPPPPPPQEPAHALDSFPNSPYSFKHNTLNIKNDHVDTIRRTLQSSWSGHHLNQSESSQTLSSNSDMGSIGSSCYKPIASPLSSLNPRLQHQHLVSLSLKANAVVHRPRPTMPFGFDRQEEPIPTASFSSSTAQTMIPLEEDSRIEHQGDKRTKEITPAQKEREKYWKSFDNKDKVSL